MDTTRRRLVRFMPRLVFLSVCMVAIDLVAPLENATAQSLAGRQIRMIVPLPNVPTIGESGYEGLETTAWWGVFAPAKLPANMAETLGKEIERIVGSDT